MAELTYAEYRAGLLDLFAAVDPIGLVAAGAPRDEYEPEIDDLVKWRTPVTADQVRQTFVRYFGESTGQISDEEATELATGITTLRARLRAR